ncbi:hypothetical protein MBLNU230_g3023t1 [Neophaeotheca triangularis]
MSVHVDALDNLVESSHYALPELPQQRQHHSQQQEALHPSFPPQLKPGSHSMDRHQHQQHHPQYQQPQQSPQQKPQISTSQASNAGQPVRRRISRACDQCNQLRTKCDGKTPCAHCVEFGLTCEYVRERKKRGKASRKDLAAQQQAPGGADVKDGSPRSVNEGSSEDQAGSDLQGKSGNKRRRSSSELQSQLPPPPPPPPRAGSLTNQQVPNGHGMHGLTGLEPTGTVANQQVADAEMRSRRQSSHTAEQQYAQQNTAMLPTPRLPNVNMLDRGIPNALGEYGSMDDYHRSILHPGTTVAGQNVLHNNTSATQSSVLHGGTLPSYGDSPYAVPSPGSQQMPPFRFGESPLSQGFLGQSPGAAGSPGWISLPSPNGGLYHHYQHAQPGQQLKYPVLRPLVPHIASIIPISLACDLLELYFSSTSAAFMQPSSPYLLGFVFRKRSFLRQHHYRICSPALLSSMLWVAAQTSESAFLTSPPSARGKICQKLLELTVKLLKPLIHSPVDATANLGVNTVVDGVALGGFGVALSGQSHEMEGGSPGATGALDDVATYIHLATVVSASEYKGASLRWWNAAWSLARELKLGRELPPNPEPTHQSGPVGSDGDAVGDIDEKGMPGYNAQNERSPDHSNNGPSPPGTVSFEEREERRRIWWLLYIVDRHLALCYNRPLFLLDIECDGLLQPENDVTWQSGEYYPGENTTATDPSLYRRRGPSFECSGHSIFGFFLPLMTILGEIVDLNHARNHPRFGARYRSSSEWDDQAAEISQQLEVYGRSLKDFEMNFSAPPPGQEVSKQHSDLNGDRNYHYENGSPSGRSVGTTSSSNRMTESVLQTRVVVAYSTHLMHTLYILLNGKWDPISLLDDNDLWISSQSFISATGHAVSAAEAINEILEYDPDLSFMPFFFGIYLLQGSFLLLLIADKLQGEASPSVVKACETIVRAHEACVVTLNTEYQRNFRKVMRSALSQVRGRMIEDFGEQQLRRREVLALYRWTGDGTGLAL